jgi:uncharacterized protein HemX
VSTWADLLTTAPLVAIIIALGITVVYLFKSRERLQTQILTLQQQHTTDMVSATGALQELTAEYLEQSFTTAQSTVSHLRGMEEQQKASVAQLGACVMKLENLDKAGEERVGRAVEKAVTAIKLELRQGRPS